MVETKNEVQPKATEREILISRVFPATRDEVWSAWSDPWQVAQWWGPKGFRTTMTEMDQRVGGMWRLVMHGPDGTDYPCEMQFLELIPKQRIVCRTHGGRAGAPVEQFDTTMTFEDHLSGTRLTIRMTFATAQQRDHNVRTYGAIEGREQMFDRLQFSLQAKQAGEAHPPPHEQHGLCITREFDAPRELVW
jgi:uncharacterized protein YndB with AHSA1/START domain